MVSMKKFLVNPYAWLVVPLLVLAAVGLAIVWPPNTKDLLTNLIVEVAGILITVLFVDWMLRRRERREWAFADAYIRGDFAATAFQLLARATTLLKYAGWKGHAVSQSDTSEHKPWAFELEYISLEEIRRTLEMADQASLAEFASDAGEFEKTLAAQHARFSTRLNAEETELILRLETTLGSVMNEFNLIGSDSELLYIVEHESKLDEARQEHLQRAAESLRDSVAQSLQLLGHAFESS